MKKLGALVLTVIFTFGFSIQSASAQASSEGSKISTPSNPYGTEGVGGCNPRPRSMASGSGTVDDLVDSAAIFLLTFFF